MALANVIILVFTALVIMWYTFETQKIRKEMIKQTELSLRPLLIVLIHQNEFLLRNIGNGTALNIRSSDIDVENSGNRIIFDEVAVLEPGQEIPFYSKSVGLDGTPVDYASTAHINPKYANRNYIITVSYENIEGLKYVSVVQSGKDGVKVKETKRLL